MMGYFFLLIKQSYDEILRVLSKIGYSREHFVFQGTRAWLSETAAPVSNPAVEDLF